MVPISSDTRVGEVLFPSNENHELSVPPTFDSMGSDRLIGLFESMNLAAQPALVGCIDLDLEPANAFLTERPLPNPSTMGFWDDIDWVTLDVVGLDSKLDPKAVHSDVAGAGSGFDPFSRRQRNAFPHELGSFDRKVGGHKAETVLFPWRCQPGPDAAPRDARKQSAECLSEHSALLTTGSTLNTEEDFDLLDLRDPPKETWQRSGDASGKDDMDKETKKPLARQRLSSDGTILVKLCTVPTAGENTESLTSQGSTPWLEGFRKRFINFSTKVLMSSAGIGPAQASDEDTLSFTSDKKESGRKRARQTESLRNRRRRPAKGNDRDEEDSEGSGADEEPPKKKANISGEIGSRRRLFACPFAKSNPWRYQECLRFKLRTWGHTKQHLARCHTPPRCCPRCYQEFGDKDAESDLRDHLSQVNACEPCDPAKVGRVTKETMDRAMGGGRRKDETGDKLNDEKRWYRAFGILFPDKTPPKSPYAESLAVEILQELSAPMPGGTGSQILEQVQKEILELCPHSHDAFQMVVSRVIQHLRDRDLSPSFGEPAPSVVKDSATEQISLNPSLTSIQTLDTTLGVESTLSMGGHLNLVAMPEIFSCDTSASTISSGLSTESDHRSPTDADKDCFTSEFILNPTDHGDLGNMFVDTTCFFLGNIARSESPGFDVGETLPFGELNATLSMGLPHDVDFSLSEHSPPVAE